MKMIDNWRAEIRRLWSIRLAIFWGALSGLYSAWGAFQEVLPPYLFAGVSMIMCAAIMGARLTKQPGADE